jgi:hypothetical protein
MVLACERGDHGDAMLLRALARENLHVDLARVDRWSIGPASPALTEHDLHAWYLRPECFDNDDRDDAQGDNGDDKSDCRDSHDDNARRGGATRVRTTRSSAAAARRARNNSTQLQTTRCARCGALVADPTRDLCSIACGLGIKCHGFVPEPRPGARTQSAPLPGDAPPSLPPSAYIPPSLPSLSSVLNPSFASSQSSSAADEQSSLPPERHASSEQCRAQPRVVRPPPTLHEDGQRQPPTIILQPDAQPVQPDRRLLHSESRAHCRGELRGEELHPPQSPVRDKHLARLEKQQNCPSEEPSQDTSELTGNVARLPKVLDCAYHETSSSLRRQQNTVEYDNYSTHQDQKCLLSGKTQPRVCLPHCRGRPPKDPPSHQFSNLDTGTSRNALLEIALVLNRMGTPSNNSGTVAGPGCQEPCKHELVSHASQRTFPSDKRDSYGTLYDVSSVEDIETGERIGSTCNEPQDYVLNAGPTGEEGSFHDPINSNRSQCNMLNSNEVTDSGEIRSPNELLLSASASSSMVIPCKSTSVPQSVVVPSCPVSNSICYDHRRSSNVHGLKLLDVECHFIHSPARFQIDATSPVPSSCPSECKQFRSAHVSFHAGEDDELNNSGNYSLPCPNHSVVPDIQSEQNDRPVRNLPVPSLVEPSPGNGACEGTAASGPIIPDLDIGVLKGLVALPAHLGFASVVENPSSSPKGSGELHCVEGGNTSPTLAEECPSQINVREAHASRLLLPSSNRLLARDHEVRQLASFKITDSSVTNKLEQVGSHDMMSKLGPLDSKEGDVRIIANEYPKPSVRNDELLEIRSSMNPSIAANGPASAFLAAVDCVDVQIALDLTQEIDRLQLRGHSPASGSSIETPQSSAHAAILPVQQHRRTISPDSNQQPRFADATTNADFSIEQCRAHESHIPSDIVMENAQKNRESPSVQPARETDSQSCPDCRKADDGLTAAADISPVQKRRRTTSPDSNQQSHFADATTNADLSIEQCGAHESHIPSDIVMENAQKNRESPSVQPARETDSESCPDCRKADDELIAAGRFCRRECKSKTQARPGWLSPADLLAPICERNLQPTSTNLVRSGIDSFCNDHHQMNYQRPESEPSNALRLDSSQWNGVAKRRRYTSRLRKAVATATKEDDDDSVQVKCCMCKRLAARKETAFHPVFPLLTLIVCMECHRISYGRFKNAKVSPAELFLTSESGMVRWECDDVGGQQEKILGPAVVVHDPDEARSLLPGRCDVASGYSISKGSHSSSVSVLRARRLVAIAKDMLFMLPPWELKRQGVRDDLIGCNDARSWLTLSSTGLPVDMLAVMRVVLVRAGLTFEAGRLRFLSSSVQLPSPSETIWLVERSCPRREEDHQACQSAGARAWNMTFPHSPWKRVDLDVRAVFVQIFALVGIYSSSQHRSLTRPWNTFHFDRVSVRTAFCNAYQEADVLLQDVFRVDDLVLPKSLTFARDFERFTKTMNDPATHLCCLCGLSPDAVIYPFTLMHCGGCVKRLCSLCLCTVFGVHEFILSMKSSASYRCPSCRLEGNVNDLLLPDRQYDDTSMRARLGANRARSTVLKSRKVKRDEPQLPPLVVSAIVSTTVQGLIPVHPKSEFYTRFACFCEQLNWKSYSTEEMPRVSRDALFCVRCKETICLAEESSTDADNVDVGLLDTMSVDEIDGKNADAGGHAASDDGETENRKKLFRKCSMANCETVVHTKCLSDCTGVNETKRNWTCGVHQCASCQDVVKPVVARCRCCTAAFCESHMPIFQSIHVYGSTAISCPACTPLLQQPTLSPKQLDYVNSSIRRNSPVSKKPATSRFMVLERLRRTRYIDTFANLHCTIDDTEPSLVEWGKILRSKNLKRHSKLSRGMRTTGAGRNLD